MAALQGEAVAEPAAEEQNAELKGEVGELQAQVADLKATTVRSSTTCARPPTNLPKVSFPGGRPTFATADGKFTAALRGQLQLDTAAYLQSAAGPIATDLRRDGPALGASATNVDAAHARDLKDGDDLAPRPASASKAPPTATGTIGCCSTSAARASRTPASSTRLGRSIPASRPFHFRVGAWPQPIGLEDQDSTNAQLFLERPAISDVARNLAAGDTRIGAGAFGYDNLWFVSGDVTGRTIGVVNTGTFITSTTTGTSARRRPSATSSASSAVRRSRRSTARTGA